EDAEDQSAGSRQTSVVHPANDLVVGLGQDAHMVRALNRKEVDERKFLREVAAHTYREHLVVSAVENRDFRFRIAFPNFSDASAVVIALDQQIGQRTSDNAGGLFSQSGEGRDRENSLHAMTHSEIDRDRGAERITDGAESRFHFFLGKSETFRQRL